MVNGYLHKLQNASVLQLQSPLSLAARRRGYALLELEMVYKLIYVVLAEKLLTKPRFQTLCS